ncbi:MAG: dihydroneopterin aldolase [Legionellales bacterium]|jgi:dihydroneopterin aldolase
MDKLYIRELVLNTTIGCLAWEKQMLQTVIVSLEMGIDCKKISETDDIHATLNYALMSEQLIAFAKQARFELIETLAQKIAEFIHQHYPSIKHLKLSLEKPGALAKVKTVGVVIERDFA